MNKHGWTIALVIVGILMLVDIIVRNSAAPIGEEILNVQSEILETQKDIAEKLTDTGPSPNMQGIGEVLTKLNAIESRINNLEDQVKPIITAYNAAQKQAAPPSDEYDKEYDIEVMHTPVLGPKDASITIVEVVDFQCPFCQRFHPVIGEVLEAYPKDVKVMIKNFPLNFHPQAKPAAKAAFAAGVQGKYYEMADLLLSNNTQLTEEKFKEHAKTLGLNVDQFMKDYKDKDATWEEYIQKDMELSQKIDVRGTPTFYLNGRKTRSRTLDAFKQEIDAILQK